MFYLTGTSCKNIYYPLYKILNWRLKSHRNTMLTRQWFLTSCLHPLVVRGRFQGLLGYLWIIKAKHFNIRMLFFCWKRLIIIALFWDWNKLTPPTPCFLMKWQRHNRLDDTRGRETREGQGYYKIFFFYIAVGVRELTANLRGVHSLKRLRSTCLNKNCC